MITSLSNAKVKQIRKLRNRKERERTGLFFAEGIRIVAEAVQLKMKIESLIFSSELLTSDFAFRVIKDLERKTNGIELVELDAPIFRKVSDKDNPQGIAAVIHQRWYSLDNIADDDHLWVALDEVQNPGNLGSIMRTNDGVGVKGVILLDQTADPYDMASVRGSMGAIFNQKLIRASLDDFISWKKANIWQMVGTSGSSALDYQEVVYPQRLVLLMGSERLGLQLAHKNICDLIVKIPMKGRSDSLNLSIATAIVLYEIFNQRRRQQR